MQLCPRQCTFGGTELQPVSFPNPTQLQISTFSTVVGLPLWPLQSNDWANSQKILTVSLSGSSADSEQNSKTFPCENTALLPLNNLASCFFMGFAFWPLASKKANALLPSVLWIFQYHLVYCLNQNTNLLICNYSGPNLQHCDSQCTLCHGCGLLTIWLTEGQSRRFSTLCKLNICHPTHHNSLEPLSHKFILIYQKKP